MMKMTPMEKAFGILCVVLLATLVGVLSYCIPTIIARNNTISSLNTQLSTKGSQITQFYYTVADLQKQVDNVTGSLNDTLSLRKSQVLCQRLGWAGGVNLWNFLTPQFEGNISYAGFIVVQIYSLWLNDTLEVKYSFQSLNYDQKIGFNGSVSAIFPVLPSSDIKVFAFTQEEGILSGPAEADITITYYY